MSRYFVHLVGIIQFLCGLFIGEVVLIGHNTSIASDFSAGFM